MIITKLNETMLKEISLAGEGTYVRANNSKSGLSSVFFFPILACVKGTFKSSQVVAAPSALNVPSVSTTKPFVPLWFILTS